MSKLPRLTGKQLIGLFRKKGYTLISVRGSHNKFRSPTGEIIIVPLHTNRPLPIGTLHYTITKMMKLTVEEFLKILEES